MFHYTLPTTLGEEKCSDRQGAYNWLICLLEWSIGKFCMFKVYGFLQSFQTQFTPIKRCFSL